MGCCSPRFANLTEPRLPSGEVESVPREVEAGGAGPEDKASMDWIASVPKVLAEQLFQLPDRESLCDHEARDATSRHDGSIKANRHDQGNSGSS